MKRVLGCPDRSLCPNQFGLPEESYLIEYVHRVLAVVGSGLVYATAIVVPSSLRKAKLVSIIAAITVSVQIILGYLTVTAGLHPFVVATNLSTGITVIAFSMITFYWIGVMKNTPRLNSTRLCNPFESCCQIHS